MLISDKNEIVTNTEEEEEEDSEEEYIGKTFGELPNTNYYGMSVLLFSSSFISNSFLMLYVNIILS